MNIEAKSLSKHFGLRPIIRSFSQNFSSGSVTAIQGPNGSGKSTLLRLLTGQLLPNSGELIIRHNDETWDVDQLSRRVNLYGPYVELIEELSGEEMLNLHQQLRGWTSGLETSDLWERVGWNKRIRRQPLASYSSGMKQRIKLLLALASDADLVALDEPTSNLDTEGVLWYRQLVTDWIQGRTLLIASNEERDFVDCTDYISADNWR